MKRWFWRRWFRYLIFGIILCCVFNTKVLAYSYSTLGNITNNVTMQVEPDYASSPISVPVNSSYNFYDVRAVDIFIGGYGISANTNYQLELVLTNQTLESANIYTVQGYNGEECLTDMGASLLSGYWLYFAFECPHATNSISITVKNSANSYLWSQSQTNIFSWERASLRSAPEHINSTPSDTDVIINNQNANTQAIIDNQNSNFNSCHKSINLFNPDNKEIFINAAANQVNTYSGNIGSYVSIQNGDYTISTRSTQNKFRVCLASTIPGTSLIPCYNGVNNDNSSSSITIHNTDNYSYLFVYASTLSDIQVQTGSTATKFEPYNQQICTNRLDNVTDSVDNLTGALTDSSSIDMSSLGDTLGWLPPGPVDSIINLPLNLLNSLSTALNGTCSPLNITVPFIHTNAQIPCISTIFANITGVTNFWNWVGGIASVWILYNYLIALYKYYDDLTTLKANFISDFGGAP